MGKEDNMPLIPLIWAVKVLQIDSKFVKTNYVSIDKILSSNLGHSK